MGVAARLRGCARLAQAHRRREHIGNSISPAGPGGSHRANPVGSRPSIHARIELEITETALLDAEAAVLKTMEQLHRRGVSFALDDFGTGFSSLASLRRFPFDKIKIDRSFVSNVGSAIDATIVHAVVSIGRALGLKVVAEGVETVEQQKFVATAGVHALQGYLVRTADEKHGCGGLRRRIRTSPRADGISRPITTRSPGRAIFFCGERALSHCEITPRYQAHDPEVPAPSSSWM